MDAQSEVVSNIAQSEVLSAGRLSDGKLYWMDTDKDAFTMSFNAMQWSGITNVPYSGEWAEFDGNGDYLRSGHNSYNITTHAFNAPHYPWAMSGVVRFDTSSKEGTFFGRSTGWHSGSGTSTGGIHLGVTDEDKIFFEWRGNYNNSLLFTSTATFDAGKDYGFYVDFNGGTTGTNSGYLNDYYSRFRIKQINLSTGAVSDVPGTWSHQGYGPGNIGSGGQLFLGKKHISDPQSLDGRVYNFVATTIIHTANNTQPNALSDMPSDAEIAMMTRDPAQWVTDYKIGKSYRIYNSGGQYANHTNFACCNDSIGKEAYATNVFLVGSGDAVQGTNDTSTRFYSMITSDSSMYAYLTINNATEGGGSTFESRNYHTFQDQITLAGEVYTDAMYNSFTSGNKRVIALNTIPIENHLASGTNDDFFYPSFFPSGMY